jgi:hypothetical protein
MGWVNFSGIFMYYNMELDSSTHTQKKGFKFLIENITDFLNLLTMLELKYCDFLLNFLVNTVIKLIYSVYYCTVSLKLLFLYIIQCGKI